MTHSAALPALLTTDDLFAVLCDAGILRAEDNITRFVIDAKGGDLVKIYVEREADVRLLAVVQTLKGVEITWEDRS